MLTNEFALSKLLFQHEKTKVLEDLGKENTMVKLPTQSKID